MFSAVCLAFAKRIKEDLEHLVFGYNMLFSSILVELITPLLKLYSLDEYGTILLNIRKKLSLKEKIRGVF